MPMTQQGWMMDVSLGVPLTEAKQKERKPHLALS